MEATSDLDQRVRHQVYAALASSGRAPSAAALGETLAAGDDELRAALERLHEAHALVLDERTREVRMALPFSNVPTSFRVESEGRSWDVNCAWDALALVRMLGLAAARVVDEGGAGRESRTLHVAGGQLVERDGVISFARPAWRWWDDIVFT